MKQIDGRIRLIFVPFVIIVVALVVGYTFLHWLLFIQTDKIKIDPDIINFFVPMFIPWIPLLIWLRPRIKLLKLKRAGRRDPVLLYLLLAWFVTIAPLLITQSYIETATGKLTALDHISQIDSLPKTKYYTLKHFYIDKRLARIKSIFKVIGKSNEDFDMSIYAASPIYNRNSNTDTVEKQLSLRGTVDKNAETPPVAWLAVKYRKIISNKLSADEKQAAFKQFAAESQQDFDTRDLNYFTYLEKMGYSSDLKGYTKAVGVRESDTQPVILSPVNEAFEARNGDKFGWIFVSFAIGCMIFMICLFFSPLRTGVETGQFNLKEYFQK